MSVLVDDALWPWRGALWAHLVSDESVAELHAFAERLGLRRMAFQGDHYDVSADVRERALTLGAQAVRGRELVRRLRSAGLRLDPHDRPGKWVEVWRCSPTGFKPDLMVEVPAPLDGAVSAVDADWGSAEVVVYERPAGSAREVVVVVEDASGVFLSDVVLDKVEVWRHDDCRVELLVRIPAVIR